MLKQKGEEKEKNTGKKVSAWSRYVSQVTIFKSLNIPH